MDCSHCGIVHAILATLPVREFISTSIDTKLARASEVSSARSEDLADKHRIGVLPLDAGCKRWMIPINGSTRDQSGIVLYEGEEETAQQRQAMNGIVQALLLTRHVLFLGFRLQNDYSMHSILDTVQKARAKPEDEDKSSFMKEPFRADLNATLIRRLPNKVERSLWKNANVITLQDPDTESNCGCESEKKNEASRKLEIFLDYLAVNSRGFNSHLLDEECNVSLTSEENEVRNCLHRLAEQTMNSGINPESNLFNTLDRMFQKIGLPLKTC